MEQSDEAFYTLINGLRANLDQGWAGDTLTEEDVVVLLAGITRLRAALADYERRILSAVEAVPASQIRAEALSEAAAAVDKIAADFMDKAEFYTPPRTTGDPYLADIHHQAGVGVSQAAAAILALIDAPKVTT